MKCRAARWSDPKANKLHNADRSFYHSHQWAKLVAAAKKRDGLECSVCGSDQRVARHHIVGRKQGGPDALSNLVSLCIGCHGQLEADIRAGRDSELRRLVEG